MKLKNAVKSRGLPSDVYSFAATMMTAITEEAVSENRLNHWVALSQDITKQGYSQPLQDLLGRMLASEPGARPTMEEVLKDPWFASEEVQKE